MDYSKTLRLPQTEFPMRGNLPQKEPQFVELWKDKDLYNKRIEKRKKAGAPRFVLHDGPPYANGKIHIGHALNKTLKDIIVRYKYMAGYMANYVPGWDTHGLPIEYAVLKDSGEDRANMSVLELRRKCLEYAKKWIEIQKTDFIRMGVIGDFDNRYVTFDPHLEAKEIEVFGEMARKGYIYKGKKAVYWCPHCETALAEAEIEYKDRKSPSIYVKFPAKNIKGLGPEGVDQSKLFAVIWTTTPWTIPANQYISVNPKFTYVWVHNLDADEYYLMNKELAPAALADCKIENYEFAGREMTGAEWELAEFMHPWASYNRTVYVLEGNHVTLDAGTGCVHTAPGHGVDDFEVYKKYENEGKLKQEVICPVDDKGRMTAEAGSFLEGKTVWEAEGPSISALAHEGMLLGKKSLHHQYAHCWRCKNPVIYRATEQWFASINDFREDALKAVDETRFIPSWGHDRLYNMIRDRQDWCISRQLWWGHRIPVWYCDDCGEVIASRTDLEACPKCGSKHIRQDPDVLDTWFSSALWPFSTMGWPDRTPVLNQWYPTSTMVTGYDIIFFWVARMMFMSMEFMKEIPFKYVFIHGLVRDSQGRKMSKSLGNGIDPLEVIEKYGADALRFTLVTGNTPGNDMRFYYERVEGNRNFANKLWNASKFTLMNLDDYDPRFIPEESQYTLADKWILEGLAQTEEHVSENLDKYELGAAADSIYDFAWNSFCDWYIETAKGRLYGVHNADRQVTQYVLVYVLTRIMALLHPFMPFITEHLWQHLPHSGETLARAPWPAADERLRFPEEQEQMERIMDAIKAVRNMRAEANVAPNKMCHIRIAVHRDDLKKCIETHEEYFEKLGHVEKIVLLAADGTKPENALAAVVTGMEVYLELKGLIDTAKERERIEKAKAALEKEIARTSGKLNNKGFLAKAPEDVVAKEKEKLAEFEEKMKSFDERLRFLADL